MLPIRFDVQAEIDIDSGFAWYNHCRSGLGTDFLLCVEEAIDRIRHYPESYVQVHNNVRRALMRRFPFGVFYSIDQTHITIMGVLPTHQAPKYS